MAEDRIVHLADAVILGIRWYFTGVPCRHGHVSKRSVSNRECRACVDARHRQKRAIDPAPYRTREKARREANPELYRQHAKASRARHIEARREGQKAAYRRNPEAAKVRAKKWQSLNPGKLAYQVQRRRAWVKQATPKWLTKEQRREMMALYVEAASRPGEWHVDHVVPLRNKLVCGLNVPWNLQIITGDENRQKGNRFDVG